MTTWTVAPAPVSRRVRWPALYAAMPPVTPRSTRRPASGLLDASSIRPFCADRALRDLLERDGQRLVPQTSGLDERRHELSAALAELVVIGVDLASALRGDDHE